MVAACLVLVQEARLEDVELSGSVEDVEQDSARTDEQSDQRKDGKAGVLSGMSASFTFSQHFAMEASHCQMPGLKV